MKPVYKGLILAAVQIALLASLGGKYLLDRATRPRVWLKVTSVAPDSSLGGRYLRLTLDSSSQMIPAAGMTTEAREFQLQPTGTPFEIPNREVVAFFISENAPNVFKRAEGEELWVEVTVPKKGPPRPIRLGMKKGEALTVLDLR